MTQKRLFVYYIHRYWPIVRRGPELLEIVPNKADSSKIGNTVGAAEDHVF